MWQAGLSALVATAIEIPALDFANLLDELPKEDRVHPFFSEGFPSGVRDRRSSSCRHAFVDFDPDILGHATTVAIACRINAKSPIAFAPAGDSTVDQIGSDKGENSSKHAPAFNARAEQGQSDDSRTGSLRLSDVGWGL